MVKKFDKDTIIGMAESDCKSGVKNFADKIHSLRKSSKITLADLSNMSGVPSSTISDVEKAKYVPSLDIILKLGYALELQRDEIFDLLKGNNLKLNMLENADFMIKMETILHIGVRQRIWLSERLLILIRKRLNI